MASAAPNTAVTLPAATATSATIGVAAPPVSTIIGFQNLFRSWNPADTLTKLCGYINLN